MFMLRGLAADDWSTMTPDEAQSGEDRETAAAYCGKRFGVTDPNFQPCVDFYAGPHIGEYVPKGTATTPTTTTTRKLPIATHVNLITNNSGQAVLTTAGKIQATLMPPGVPWYKTPLGLGALVLGGLAVFRKLKK